MPPPESSEAPHSIVDVCASWEPHDQRQYLASLQLIMDFLSALPGHPEKIRKMHEETILMNWFGQLLPLFDKYNVPHEERDRVRRVLGFRASVSIIAAEQYEMVDNAVGSPIASIYHQITEKLRQIPDRR